MGAGRLVGMATLLGVLMLGTAGAARAQAQTETFTLRPGGTATISFEAFCTEFGELFPSALQAPDGIVPEATRAALAYGVGAGLNANGEQALQLQYALWQTLGETSSPRGGATAQDVLANGTNAPAAPQATSLLDAARAGQVGVTLDSWQPIGPEVAITATATDNFYGRGQLTVTNRSQQELTLYMPVGTRFPSVDADEQTMTGYATRIEVRNPQAAAQPAQQPAAQQPAQPAAQQPAAQQLPNTSGFVGGLTPIWIGLSLLAASVALRRLRTRRP